MARQVTTSIYGPTSLSLLLQKGRYASWFQTLRLHGQLSIPPPQPRAINSHPDVRSNNRDIPREARYGSQEIAKEDHDAVQLDAEAYERPSQQNERQAAEEGRRALGLVFPGEEEERLLRSDYDC